MNKFEIGMISFLLGMAAMNDIRACKDKLVRWLNKKSEERDNKLS